MSILTPIPPSVPWYSRVLLKLPVLGWIARDVLFGHRENIWYALAIVATVWILAISTWGLVAFAVPFVASVPLCFVLLLLISRG
ncbi:hypothetical protein [Meridianimarinicoccus sp. MJW13]|uniref:hypothetical protein n=1 Tax=Meridianimarinicoccus sp. MJW13 TaxID=2720031 RepID=UPI00186849FC|nr:hypothetical protein [Fluviibacterium sp. MJW13]